MGQFLEGDFQPQVCCWVDFMRMRVNVDHHQPLVAAIIFLLNLFVGEAYLI